MTVIASPTYPIVGDVVTLTMTRTINDVAVEVEQPTYQLTAGPPGSTLSTQALLATLANPTGTVAAATSNTRRHIAINLSEAAGYFDGATLRFTSGKNTGRTIKVSTHTSGAFDFVGELPQLPLAGDTFTIEDQDTRRLSFKPDKAGAYTFRCGIYREVSNSPTFDGDPATGSRRELIGTENVTIHVGVVADLPIAYASGKGITLRLKAHNATVRAAELVNPLTSEDYLASVDSTVVAKLAALVGQPVASVGPDLTVGVPVMRTKYEAHRVLVAGTVHAATDATNVYVADAPTSQSQCIQALNELRRLLVAHFTGASSAGTRWHTADDTKNVPVIPPATTLAAAQVLYADCWRAFERHRVQIIGPASHGTPGDTTNALGAIDKQSDLIVAFLDLVTSASPSVPTGASSAEVALQATYGYAISG